MDSGASPCGKWSPIAIRGGNLSMPENFYMMSVYVHPHIQTLGVGVKVLGRVEKGVRDMYIVFCFGKKLTFSGATNGVARVKI